MSTAFYLVVCPVLSGALWSAAWDMAQAGESWDAFAFCILAAIPLRAWWQWSHDR